MNDWFSFQLLTDWFCCICLENINIVNKKIFNFKILLLIYNAPVDPIHLDELVEHFKFIFISPNAIALMQPIDQGVIAEFKAYYLPRTFWQLIEAMGNGDISSIVLIFGEVIIFFMSFRILENCGEKNSEVYEWWII